jgi:tRNA threonylcarbamoyladenosine biosynthesis protein TsaE
MPNVHVDLSNLTATEKLAAHIAPLLQAGDMIALYGDLGAGKTTFARALLHALGITGDIPSPTFTLVQNYETPKFTLAHFDLYRLKSPTDLEELGWFDMTDSVIIAEWPERAGNNLPDNRLDLNFIIDQNNQRRCSITPHGHYANRFWNFP